MYRSIEEFRAAYLDGSLHPGDLKSNLARLINEMVQPVRNHFSVSEGMEQWMLFVLGKR